MMQRLNKKRVQQRFSRAAATYDRQAVIQYRVGERLTSLIRKHIDVRPDTILEIGCCTGLLTAEIYAMFPGLTTLYANDLVADFQDVVRAKLKNDSRLVFLPGDIEIIALPGNLDLVVSSSTLHWVTDLPALFKTLSRRMNPGSAFCFSMYGNENLREIRDTTAVGLPYYTRKELAEVVSRSFDILACEEDHIPLAFDSPLALLRHLRETGVNSLTSAPWTRTRLDRFCHDYSARYSREGKVFATYHPMYCIATLPE